MNSLLSLLLLFLLFSLSWSGLGWLLRLGWGSFWFWSWLSGFLGSFLFLKIFGEEFFVSDVSFFGGFPGVNSASLVEDLSSDSLFGDKSLDVRSFVESFSIFLL